MRGKKSSKSIEDPRVYDLLKESLLLQDVQGAANEWHLVEVRQGAKATREFRRNFKAISFDDAGNHVVRIVKARGATMDLAQHDLSRRVAERENVWADTEGKARPYLIERHSLGGNRAVHVVKKSEPTLGGKKPLPPSVEIVGGDPPTNYGPETIKRSKAAYSLLEVWDMFREKRREQRKHGHYTVQKDTSYRNFLAAWPTTAQSVGNRRLAELSEEDVSDLLDGYESEKSPTTVYRGWSAFSTMGDWARRRGYWATNWFEDDQRGLKSGAIDRGRVLSYREIDAWFRAADDEPWLLAALWLKRVGLRIEDVLGLSEENVIGDDRILIRLSQKRTARSEADGAERRERGRRLWLGPPKGQSAGELVVGAHIVSVLRAALGGAVECAVPSYLDHGKPRARRFVVHNEHGEIYGYTGFQKRLASRAKKIGFVYDAHLQSSGKRAPKDQLNHMWKHTFATDLVALGADGIELREIARHTDENLTKTVYAKGRDEDKRYLRHYKGRIQRAREYIPMIVQMDLDRRAGRSPWGSDWSTAKPLDYPGLIEH